MKKEDKVEIVVKSGFRAEDTEQLFAKYTYHHYGAPRRGFITELTFKDYLGKAAAAGIQTPEQIGQTNQQFVLARFGDQGDYSNDNCRFIPGLENRQEAWTHSRNKEWVEKLRGQTLENSERVREAAAKQQGRTKETHEYIARRAEKVTGRTKKNHAGVARRTDKLAKEFVATSPDGVDYVGKNLTEFCQTHDLDQPNLSATLRNKRAHHRGWTGYYIDDQPIATIEFK